MPDQEEESAPIAFVVLRDKSASKQNIISIIFEKCRKELKEYEIPKAIKIMDSLPYTANGKYDFRALEEIAKVEV